MKKTYLIIAACVVALTINSPAQSILTEKPIPAEQARALRAVENAQGFRNSIIGGLRHSITDLWSSDHEANVATAAALGARGAELSIIYEAFFSQTRALLVAAGDTNSVADLDSLASRVPPHTRNPDGTLTITPPPEPEPEE